MKRSPELLPLSREHQSALSLALRAKRAAASGDGMAVLDLAAVVVHVAESELEPHFRQEEAGLLPALRRAGEVERVERTLREHQRMRDLAAQLAAHPDATALAEFGALLESHARFEERELFEVAQARLDLSGLNDNNGGETNA